MNVYEYAFYLAFFIRSRRNCHVTLLCQQDGAVLAIGLDRMENGRDYATAAVNALMGRTGGLPHSAFLCCTSAPTDACMGMAILRGIKTICYPGAHGFVRLKLKAHTSRWMPHAQAVGGTLQVPGAVHNFDRMNAINKTRVAADWQRTFRAGSQMHTITGQVIAMAPQLRYAAPAAIAVPAEPRAAGAASPFRKRLLTQLALAIVAAREFRPRQLVLNATGTAAAFAAPAARSGHNIGAVLVSATGEILAASVNNNATHTSLHAETQLIIQYLDAHGRNGLPAGCKLYTTLQCCHMCAGMIAHTCNGAVEVFYAQVDAGMADNLLERGIKGCSEARTTAMGDTGAGLDARLGLARRGGARATVTGTLNDSDSSELFRDAIYEYRALGARASSEAEGALWDQGAEIINTVMGRTQIHNGIRDPRIRVSRNRGFALEGALAGQAPAMGGLLGLINGYAE